MIDVDRGKVVSKIIRIIPDAPYMAHTAPRKSAKIVWTFNRPDEFGLACLVAGHFEAGKFASRLDDIASDGINMPSPS
ncbi:MAG: hypothetical protein H7315_04680 [Herminiimonas sp.]|nr:hypothetical protein [Herminiimonas sp.]